MMSETTIGTAGSSVPKPYLVDMIFYYYRPREAINEAKLLLWITPVFKLS